MKKKFLALAAVAVMVVSSVITSFADTTTGLIGEFKFDGDLKNSVTGELAVVTGEKVNVDVQGQEAAFANGVDGQAILLEGLTSRYGLKLDSVPTSNTFTLSYDIYYLAYTQYSPVLFLGNSWDGTTDTWASFGVGWQTTLAYAAGIWIHDLPNKTPVEWVDVWDSAGNGDMLLDTSGAWASWANITYVITEGVPTIYINGTAIEAGTGVAGIDFVDSTTQLFLGVNAWDSPLNGAVDNVLIYDRALTAEDVAELVASRDYDAAKKPEVEAPETTSNKPVVADKDNNPWITQETSSTADDNSGIDPMIIVIIAVVVVVVIVVIVVAVVASKKKKDEDLDDEE